MTLNLHCGLLHRLLVFHGPDVAAVVPTAARLLHGGPDHHADAQAQQRVGRNPGVEQEQKATEDVEVQDGTHHGGRPAVVRGELEHREGRLQTLAPVLLKASKSTLRHTYTHHD